MDIKNILINPGYYYNRLLQKIEFRTGIHCSRPSEVWLKLTERCNCRCLMCDIWKKNRDSEGELSTEEWKGVLLGLRQWLGKKYIWFTGGEPFLRKDCIELIHYSSSLGLSIGVITNGIILKPGQMSLLIDAGLKEYHVSIDSMTPEIHDHLRGVKGAHKRAIENVLALKEALKANGKHMKIVIKTIIMGHNAKEIFPLVEWAEENRFNEIKFQPLESNLEGNDDPEWFKTSPYWPKEKEVDEVVMIIDELINKKQTDSGIQIHNPTLALQEFKNYYLDPASYYEKAKSHTFASKKKQSRACASGVGWMEILSRGGLRMCLHMPPQGDIRTTTPREFWKNRPTCWKNPDQLCFKGNYSATDSHR